MYIKLSGTNFNPVEVIYTKLIFSHENDLLKLVAYHGADVVEYYIHDDTKIEIMSDPPADSFIISGKRNVNTNVR